MLLENSLRDVIRVLSMVIHLQSSISLYWLYTGSVQNETLSELRSKASNLSGFTWLTRCSCWPTTSKVTHLHFEHEIQVKSSGAAHTQQPHQPNLTHAAIIKGRGVGWILQFLPTAMLLLCPSGSEASFQQMFSLRCCNKRCEG